MLTARRLAFGIALFAGPTVAQTGDPPHVVFLVGESEYGSKDTMPAFARRLAREHGFDTTVHKAGGQTMPKVGSLVEADVLVLFLRFREASDEQVQVLEQWIRAGKPTIALRTTSHALSGREGWFPPLFGGHYKAHAPNDLGTTARVSAAWRQHEILKGLPAAFECGEGGTYDSQPLSEGARVLLFGRSGDLPSQPIAWTYREAEGARLFYTSLGTRENMQRPEVQRMLDNAVLWGLGRGSAAEREIVRAPAPPRRQPPADAIALFDGTAAAAWKHWDPSVTPRAIEIDERADTSRGGESHEAARWPVENGALVARPGFGDVVTRDSFGNYQLHVEFWVPPEPDGVTGDARGASGVYLGGRYEIQIRDSHRQPVTDTSCGAVHGSMPPAADAARPAGEWQSLDLHYRHERGHDPVLSAWLNGVQVHDAVTLNEPTVYAFGEGGDETVERLRGLRRAWPAEDTPNLSDGRFAFVARFKSDGDGTLIGKAPAVGKWAPHGKTLFLRGGRLVYDIGWVGALTSRRKFDDGEWHTAVLAHEGSTALLFVDGELEGTREEFASRDVEGHVLKVGATSPNFGGPLLEGRIAEVAVYAEPLGRAAAQQVSGGHPAPVQPAVQWKLDLDAEVAFGGDERTVVEAPIRLQADCSEVRFANVWVRPLGEVDHKALIAAWDRAAYQRGKRLYSGMCVACHGQDGEKVVHPQARAFSVAELQNGSDPLSLFGTLTEGFRTMPPQTWMTPRQRYDVVHYLREAFLRERNASQYFEVKEDWLASLPAALPPLPGEVGVVAGDGDDLPARDFGPALISQIGSAVPAGLTVRLPHDRAIGYDLHTMRTAGAWRDGFLDLSATQHYQQRGEGIARRDGEPLPGLGTWGWAFGGSFERPVDKLPRGPVPRPAYERRGHYVHGRELVLSYAIEGRGVLEWPTAVAAGDQVALVHTLRIEPGTSQLQLAVARLPRAAAAERSHPVAVIRADGVFAAAALRGDVAGLALEVDEDGRLVLSVPASERARTLAVVRASGRGEAELDGFRGWLELTADQPVADVQSMTAGGPRLWPEVLETRGRLGDGDGAYVVDTLSLPADNPWGAWLRTSALGCFADGRLAVATLGGDVWIVEGVDAGLRELRWKRFAAGLFEPLGLEVVDGLVLVTCRDGVVRLHDHNADGEADFYETFFADPDVTASFHAFNFDLQRDSKGNLYYVKSGRYTQFPIPGAVMALPPEGGTHRVLATGFRTPNGMGILPDDSLLVSDNQGNWVPASKVSRIREGGFYGVFRTAKKEREDFDRPILWLPQEVDSSSGGQLWVDDPRFGPLAGHLLHTSFGKGWVYALTLQELGDVTQASSVTLPFQFAAGVQRARVNPADGQVYVTGLSGWQGPSGGDDGCVQRLRYTGRAEARLLGAVARRDGIELRFSGVLARGAADPALYQAERWNYRWTASYGSRHYSLREPDRAGHDSVGIRSAELIDDGRAVRLVLEDMRVCDQLRVRCAVPARSGTTVRDVVHMTVHVL